VTAIPRVVHTRANAHTLVSEGLQEDSLAALCRGAQGGGETREEWEARAQMQRLALAAPQASKP
jgi:hypothetical protein